MEEISMFQHPALKLNIKIHEENIERIQKIVNMGITGTEPVLPSMERH
jgi:hypothetical protein